MFVEIIHVAEHTKFAIPFFFVVGLLFLSLLLLTRRRKQIFEQEERMKKYEIRIKRLIRQIENLHLLIVQSQPKEKK